MIVLSAQSVAVRVRLPGSEETEAAGERLGGEPGERDVQRARGRSASAQVDEKAEIVMLVGLEVLPIERGGDVPGDEPALPLRVLRGHSGPPHRVA
jgi:hypothetical protein